MTVQDILTKHDQYTFPSTIIYHEEPLTFAPSTKRLRR